MAAKAGRQEVTEEAGRTARAKSTAKAAGTKPAGAVVERRFGGLFKLYKPTQGKQVRLWTGVGAGVLLVFGADWMFEKLSVSLGEENLWLATLITAGICGAIAIWLWYLIGVKPSSVDFLIAVEGEMKKVTWSTRAEVVGATKVVIAMVLMMAVGLFVVDAVFASFFAKIGVLKVFGG